MAAVTGSRVKRRLTPATQTGLGIAGLVTVLAIWQITSMTGVLSPKAVPPPIDVAAAFAERLVNTDFWAATLSTVAVSLIGVVIVILIAIPLAMAIHRYFIVRESSWFLVEFLKPIPPVALIPLTILLWGPTKSVELFLVVFAALWPMLTQLVYGMREVSGVAIEMGRVYRLTPWQRTSRIIVPSLTPFAMTGLRISITMGLVTAIVTEYVVGIPGLGSMLRQAQTNGILDRMYAVIIAMGLIGLAFNAIVTLLNRPMLFWHASQREKVRS